MRVRMVVSVLVVMGVVYGLTLGWHHAVGRARDYVQEQIVPLGGLGTETARYRDSFDLGGASRLAIENDFGSVEVRPGGPKLVVERVVYAGGQDDQARARAARFSLSSGKEPGGGYRISVRGGGERHPWQRVDLMVEAPPSLSVQVRLKAGSVRAAGLGGPLSISVQSGSISVRNIGGAVTASTGSGKIALARVRGGAGAKTGSGGIELSGIRGRATAEALSGSLSLSDVIGGEVAASTGSGSIRLEEVDSQRITARTASGSIRISLAAPFAGSLQAHTNSGSITLALPASSNCRVEGSTGSGAITSRLALRSLSSSPGHLAGALGAGQGKVEVSTGSGSVTVEPTL